MPVSLQLAKDFLHPSLEEERKHKLKWLVQSPNSFFMNIETDGVADDIIGVVHTN